MILFKIYWKTKYCKVKKETNAHKPSNTGSLRTSERNLLKRSKYAKMPIMRWKHSINMVINIVKSVCNRLYYEFKFLETCFAHLEARGFKCKPVCRKLNNKKWRRKGFIIVTNIHIQIYFDLIRKHNVCSYFTHFLVTFSLIMTLSRGYIVHKLKIQLLIRKKLLRLFKQYC
jgi:hypothetical protein